MTPEQRAREFVEVGFRSLGVPLEPYVQIVAELIAGAETELRAEGERLTAALEQHEVWQASLVQQLVDKDAEVERLNAMLDWCDKMEPGIKRRSEIAIMTGKTGHGCSGAVGKPKP